MCIDSIECGAASTIPSNFSTEKHNTLITYPTLKILGLMEIFYTLPNAELAFCVQEHAATPCSLKIRVTSILHFKAREPKIA